MNLISYLHQHLLPASALDQPRLHSLALRGMAPQPSYRLRMAIDCTSFFGPHSESCQMDFYATGTAAWLDAVSPLADGEAAFALFAQRYQATVARLGVPECS